MNIFLQSGSQILTEIQLPEIIIGVVSVGVGIAVVLVTIHFHQKNLTFNAILRVYELLNNQENRKAREYIYRRWENEYLPKKNVSLFNVDEFKEKALKVATDFDEIGVLIYKKIDLKTLKTTASRYDGFLPRGVFLTAYSGAVVNSWVTLRDFLKKEAKERETKYFKRYFKRLYTDALVFRKKNELGKTRIQKLAKKNKIVND